ncbi:MAG TPA: hypothetical protein VJS45_14130 [Acidimicrobiia bacterium]|nr:hypothetical protein [Acidimicrobiia bacterium]
MGVALGHRVCVAGGAGGKASRHGRPVLVDFGSGSVLVRAGVVVHILGTGAVVHIFDAGAIDSVEYGEKAGAAARPDRTADRGTHGGSGDGGLCRGRQGNVD